MRVLQEGGTLIQMIVINIVFQIVAGSQPKQAAVTKLRMDFRRKNSACVFGATSVKNTHRGRYLIFHRV